MEMSANRKGDFAEYYAVTWLWDNGYDVFINAGCDGPIDMIAYKDGEATLVDVKTVSTFKDSRRTGATRTEQQKKMGVVFLAFDPTNRELFWIKHHETNDKQLGLELE